MTKMGIDDFQIDQIPIQPVNDPFLSKHKLTLSILRCDLIHPELSGNKWFKLKYNLLAAREQGYETLLSFGGAWSNHIHALAAAGRLFNFKTIGVIRGELSNIQLTPSLRDASDNGMRLHGVSRAVYRDKEKCDYINSLHEKFGDFYLIPEGGANLNGMKGCGNILSNEMLEEYDYISLACGTGTTIGGIISTQDSNNREKTEPAKSCEVLGIQVLKATGYLERQVRANLDKFELKSHLNWSINDNYHFGGYAKKKPELMDFIAHFQNLSAVPLEPVYSGKLLYGLYDLIKKNYFKNNSHLLAIHGGGLQGDRSFKDDTIYPPC